MAAIEIKGGDTQVVKELNKTIQTIMNSSSSDYVKIVALELLKRNVNAPSNISISNSHFEHK